MEAPIVLNMKSSKGNKVPNQFIIWTDDYQFFQSYQTIIGRRDIKGNIFLDKNRWDYSVTTGRYRNIFLCEKMKQTKEKIKSGEYYLIPGDVLERSDTTSLRDKYHYNQKTAEEWEKISEREKQEYNAAYESGLIDS